jgi:hypothetical protein
MPHAAVLAFGIIRYSVLKEPLAASSVATAFDIATELWDSVRYITPLTAFYCLPTVIRTVELMGRFHDSRVINMFYNGFLSKPYIGFLYVLLLVNTWQ